MDHKQKLQLIKTATQGPGILAQIKDTIAGQFKVKPSDDELNAILGSLVGVGIGGATEGWKGALTGGITGGIGGYVTNKIIDEPKSDKADSDLSIFQRGKNLVSNNPTTIFGLGSTIAARRGATAIDSMNEAKHPNRPLTQSQQSVHNSYARSAKGLRGIGYAAPIIGFLADSFNSKE